MTFVDRMRRHEMLLLGLVGVAAGIMSGLLGVGGGLILVPGMIFAAGFPQHDAHATSLAAIVPTALAGAVIFGNAGSVDVPTGILLIVGSLAGVRIGARMMRGLDAARLRRLLGAFILLVAFTMVVR